MMMPEIIGAQFSIHRIRTTIRRPSKNRKAMKELIERNRKSNLLMRRFKQHRPGEVRLTDVTYLDYGDDKRAYGSAIVDPVTGRLICFVISENNDLQLALDTLKAIHEYPAVNGAILHSDYAEFSITMIREASISLLLLPSFLKMMVLCSQFLRVVIHRTMLRWRAFFPD